MDNKGSLIPLPEDWLSMDKRKLVKNLNGTN